MDELTPLYRALVEAAFDALVITRAGDMVYANPSFVEMSGFSLDEIIGQPVLRFVAPECHEQIKRVMTGSEAQQYEAIGLRKDGSRIDVAIVAHPCVYQGAPARVTAIRDITAAKAATEQLRRSEQRFRELVERTPDLVVVQRAGVVLYANPAMARFIGVGDAAELVGRSLLEIVHPDDRERLVRRLELQRDGGTVTPLESFRHVSPDGRVGVLEIVSVPIELDGVPAMLALGRDVTARQAVDQRLIHAELMAALGTTAAAVNHELNNALTFMALTERDLAQQLTALMQELPATVSAGARNHLERLAQLTHDMREGVARVTTIAHDFRGLARVREAPLEAVDVAAVLASAIRVADAEVRPHARLEADLQAVARVRANAGRLGQVVLNLVVNAAQAPSTASPRVIRVSTRGDGDHVLIDVEDNGPGIAAELAARIFEPFFSTKPAGEGTGLGLAICKSLVEGFGGTIQLARSELGGALFRVRLRAAAP